MPVSKPPVLPRWATGAAVMSEPPEGVKDTGFVPGTDAAAAHINWLLNQLYHWIQYVDDPATLIAQSLVAGGLTINPGGSITAPTINATGNAAVGGTLGVSGATTIGSTLGVSGALTAGGGVTVPSGQNATLQGNATVGGTLGVSGATTIGGTLGVGAALTAGGGLTVPNGRNATLQGNATVGGSLGVTGPTTIGGTLGVTGAATVGSVTVAANQHVTVSGAGDYKHGDRTLQLPASAGMPINVSNGLSGQPATSATGWKYNRSIGIVGQFWYGPASNQEVIFPVELAVGHRIKSVSARIQDTGGFGNTISMYVHRTAVTTSFTSGSSLIGSQTSLGNGAVQTLTLAGLTQLIGSFELYNVVLRANGSDFTNHRIAGVQVTYDRP